MSDLTYVTVTLELGRRRGKGIPARKGEREIMLPWSQIEVMGPGPCGGSQVRMPRWLAEKKRLA